MIILVTKIPEGPAPEVFRKSWLGVEITAQPFNGPLSDFTSENYKPIENPGSYMVLADEAIGKLEEKDPIAANWFRQYYPSGSGKHLVFLASDVEVKESG